MTLRSTSGRIAIPGECHGAAELMRHAHRVEKLQRCTRPGRLAACDGVREAQQVDQRRPRIDGPDGRRALQGSRHPMRGPHEAIA